MLDYGQCYLNVNKRLLWVVIHKNMSSAMRPVMTEQQWKFTNFMRDRDCEELMPKLTVFCITRDPFERWLSAMAQYWYGHDLGEMTKQELMKIRFDHHSDRQTDYLKGFDGQETVQFYMGREGFEQELAQYIGVDKIGSRNQSKDRDIKLKIIEHINSIMDDELEHAVKTYYKADYNFIQNGILPK